MRAESFHLFRPGKLCLRCPTTNYHATTESAGSAGGGGGVKAYISPAEPLCFAELVSVLGFLKFSPLIGLTHIKLEYL